MSEASLDFIYSLWSRGKNHAPTSRQTADTSGSGSFTSTDPWMKLLTRWKDTNWSRAWRTVRSWTLNAERGHRQPCGAGNSKKISWVRDVSKTNPYRSWEWLGGTDQCYRAYPKSRSQAFNTADPGGKDTRRWSAESKTSSASGDKLLLDWKSPLRRWGTSSLLHWRHPRKSLTRRTKRSDLSGLNLWATEQKQISRFTYRELHHPNPSKNSMSCQN